MMFMRVKLQQPESKLHPQTGGEGGSEQHHAGDVDPLTDPRRRVVAFYSPAAAERPPD